MQQRYGNCFEFSLKSRVKSSLDGATSHICGVSGFTPMVVVFQRLTNQTQSWFNLFFPHRCGFHKSGNVGGTSHEGPLYTKQSHQLPGGPSTLWWARCLHLEHQELLQCHLVLGLGYALCLLAFLGCPWK